MRISVGSNVGTQKGGKAKHYGAEKTNYAMNIISNKTGVEEQLKHKKYLWSVLLCTSRVGLCSVHFEKRVW